ncbi:MAG: hypothetical protein NZT92_22210 [Abditibacteriales bacterium]|nr:hypothetical protein [Abditibacteriales bacterium]
MKHCRVHQLVVLLGVTGSVYFLYRTAPAGTPLEKQKGRVDPNRPYTFTAVNRPFSEVLRTLISRYHLPIVAEVPDEDPRVSVRVENSPLSALLDKIADQAKMKWRLVDGYIVFLWKVTPLRSLGGTHIRSVKVEELLDFWDSLAPAQRSQLNKGLLLYRDLTGEQQKKLERFLQREFPTGFGRDVGKDTLTAVRIAFFPSMTITSQGTEIGGFAVRTLSSSQRSLLLNPQTGEVTILPPDQVWFTLKGG